MSRFCNVWGCGRMIIDSSDDLGCSLHWARVRLFTKQRLRDARDPAGYSAAIKQALQEMNTAPALLRDDDYPWNWSACQTNTCNEDTCDGPEAHERVTS